MELRHLRYFVTVAESGSFVKAARALHLAQPALSRQIQDLERTLGATLLERLPHGVKLTVPGRGFLRDARRMLLAAARATSRVRGTAGARPTTLRVGYAELIGYWREVADTLGQFQTAFPKVKINIAHLTAPQIRSGLREDRIDVGIALIAKWPPRGLDGLRVIDGWQTGALIPAGHPAAARERIRLADLAELTWYHMPADATMGTFEWGRAALRARGATMKHRVSRAGGFTFLPQIAAGGGWSPAGPRLGKIVTSATKSIVYRPFVDAPALAWMAVLWKKGQRSSVVHDFANLMSDICEPERSETPPE